MACVTLFSWAPFRIICTSKKMSPFSEWCFMDRPCPCHPAHAVLCLNKGRLASVLVQTLWLTLIYIKELHQSYHPLNIHNFFHESGPAPVGGSGQSLHLLPKFLPTLQIQPQPLLGGKEAVFLPIQVQYSSHSIIRLVSIYWILRQ